MKYYLKQINDGYLVCFDDAVKKFSVYVKLADDDFTETLADEIEVEDGKEVYDATFGEAIRCGKCKRAGHRAVNCKTK